MVADAAVTQDLAQELRVPESAAAYRDVIESLPELVRTQATCLSALAEDLDERGGPGLQRTVASMHELADAMEAAVDPAEQAALVFAEEADFWLGGG
jgi:hypothetical protein